MISLRKGTKAQSLLGLIAIAILVAVIPGSGGAADAPTDCPKSLNAHSVPDSFSEVWAHFAYIGFLSYERGSCLCDNGSLEAYDKFAHEARARGTPEEEIELSFTYDNDQFECRVVETVRP